MILGWDVGRCLVSIFAHYSVILLLSASARVTLLQRGDAPRGSSTESATATWPKQCRAILLQRGDASKGSQTKSARARLAGFSAETPPKLIRKSVTNPVGDGSGEVSELGHFCPV